MSEVINIEVSAADSGLRLDKFLADHIGDLSRSRLKGLIIEGAVSNMQGSILFDPSRKVQGGDVISITLPVVVDTAPQPENIALDILFEDEHMLVINKPAGMVVHPGAGNETGTLVNALLYHCGDNLSGIGGALRPGIVHRLDKDTSGLMVAAKTDAAHHYLAEQLADRTLGRHYAALVWRAPHIRQGSVNAPIGRHPSHRLKMAVNMRNGKTARTFYTVEHCFGDVAALLDCRLESGRTHQVRVHMGHINFPLIGDPLYGIQKNGGYALLRRRDYSDTAQDYIMSFPRQALHAQKIRFIHPDTAEEMTFESELPEDMFSLISYLDQ